MRGWRIILRQDETTLQEAGVKEGQKLMLVGSAEEAPAKPQQEPTFVEDITDDDTAQQLAPVRQLPPFAREGGRKRRGVTMIMERAGEVSSRFGEHGEHVLHECHASMPQECPATSRGCAVL